MMQQNLMQTMHYQTGKLSKTGALSRVNSEQFEKINQYFNTRNLQKKKSSKLLKRIDKSSTSFRTSKQNTQQQLLRLRSTSRKSKFQSKIQKLTFNKTNGMPTSPRELLVYKNELQNLRRQLFKKQEQLFELKKQSKVVKIKEMQIELKEVYKILHQFTGMMEKSREIIELYENTNRDPNFTKKNILKQLREDNIRLNGQYSKLKYQFDTVQSKLNQVEKIRDINEKKFKKILKQKQQMIISTTKLIKPAQSTQHIEARNELQTLKIRLGSLQQNLQQFKIENNKLNLELMETKQLLEIKQSELTFLESKLQNIREEKTQIQNKLYMRLQELQQTKKQSYILNKRYQVSTYKTRQRKFLVRPEEVATIAKMIQFRLIRKHIDHNQIASLIDSVKYQNPVYPSFNEIKQLLSNNIFNLTYDERQLFAKYLLENNSPLSDDSDVQQTNSISIVKAIFQKTIPMYHRLTPSQEMNLIDSISVLFDKNKTLIEKIKKSAAKDFTEFITIANLKSFFEEYYVIVKENLFSYMEIKSFELTGQVNKLNIFKLKQYFERETLDLHKKQISQRQKDE